jgi:hypothetical protein
MKTPATPDRPVSQQPPGRGPAGGSTTNPIGGGGRHPATPDPQFPHTSRTPVNTGIPNVPDVDLRVREGGYEAYRYWRKPHPAGG